MLRFFKWGKGTNYLPDSMIIRNFAQFNTQGLTF
jgi:hypothetical protein